MTLQAFVHAKRKPLLIFAVLGLMISIVMGYINSQKASLNPTWQSLDGRSAQLQHYRKKIVLVNFWATTCSSCMQEMPMLKATQEKYQTKPFQIIALAMNYDDPAAIKAFVKSQTLPFVFGHDVDGSAATMLGRVELTPTSILLDGNGRMLKRILGVPKEEDLHRLIDDALANS